MEGHSVFAFPLSQEFSRAPRFDESPGKLQLVFDEETEDGSYQDRVVVFTGVLAYKRTKQSGVERWVVKAYDKLIEFDESPWLSSLRENYMGDGEFSFKHYVAFFDGYGCYEVVAREFCGPNS